MKTEFVFDNGSVTVASTSVFDGKQYTLWGLEEYKSKTTLLNTRTALKRMKAAGMFKGVREKKYQNGKYVAFYIRK